MKNFSIKKLTLFSLLCLGVFSSNNLRADDLVNAVKDVYDGFTVNGQFESKYKNENPEGLKEDQRLHRMLKRFFSGKKRGSKTHAKDGKKNNKYKQKGGW